MDAMRFTHTVDLDSHPEAVPKHGQSASKGLHTLRAKKRGPPGCEDVPMDSDATISDDRATEDDAGGRGDAHARADRAVPPAAAFHRLKIKKAAAAARPPTRRPARGMSAEINRRCGVLGGFLEDENFAEVISVDGAMAGHTAVLLRECHRAGVLEGVVNESPAAATALVELVRLCAHDPMSNEGHGEGDDVAAETQTASAQPIAFDASPYLQGGSHERLLAHLNDLAYTTAPSEPVSEGEGP